MMSLFDFLHKKQPKKVDAPQSPAPEPKPQAAPAQPSSPASGPDAEEKALYEAVAAKVYPGIALFARDTVLTPAQVAAYVPGAILREPGFADATSRFMGMPTSHRIVILSNHMGNLGFQEPARTWGLCTAPFGAHFKVLGTGEHQGKTGIFLLHLPDDDSWKLYRKAAFSLDDQLFDMAVQRFRAKAFAPVVPELAAAQWLDRVKDPVGLKPDGTPYPLEAESQPKDEPKPESKIRYYQLGAQTYMKQLPEGTCLIMNRFFPHWKADPQLEQDMAFGSIHPQEIEFDDHYPTAEPDLGRTRILIGSGEHCNIRLQSPEIAPEHALVYFDGADWMLHRKDPGHPVLVNGVSRGVQALRKGDELTIGSFTLQFTGLSLCFQEEGRSYVLAFDPLPQLRRTLQREKKSRYLGCLLGGAVGDALGYPVEFRKEAHIFQEYGPKGIQELNQGGVPAKISDDTQMTLFAANALLLSKSGMDFREALRTAYLEWLSTQEESPLPGSPKTWIYEIPELHAWRAPGNTCLAALRALQASSGIQAAANNSKGCGTVMRAAPFGLMRHYEPNSIGGDSSYPVLKSASFDAALTHGHPEAWESSQYLAGLVFELVQHNPHHETLQDAVSRWPGVGTVKPLVQKARELALDPQVSDLDGIHALGEGWTAAEALAIALFCAIRYQNDFGAAIRAAVNHKGDSDSTGAICGNILGAWLGLEAVEKAFRLEDLELRDLIRTVAEDLYRAVEEGVPAPGADPEWDARYRRN